MLSKFCQNIKSLHVNKSCRSNLFRFSRKTTKTYSVNEDTYIVHDTEYAYIPKEKIFFKDGASPIFLFNEFRSFRIAYFIVSSVLLYLGYYSIKKIYNWSDRRWYGLIFYSALGVLAFSKFHRYNFLYRHTTVQLDLLECGKKVRVRTSGTFFNFEQQEFDISKIQRPLNNTQQVAHMSLAFPVVFDQTCYFFFREGQIVNKELMPVVMNAKYINTQAESVEKEI